MSDLLVGDATEYPADDNQGALGSGYEEAYKYVASATGVLEQIDVWAVGHPGGGVGENGSSYTTLHLAIYADDGGEPGALLGYGSTTGPPAWDFSTSDWVSVTGLSVSITVGTAYWLTLNPHGGYLIWNRVFSDGEAWDSDDATYTTPADPFPASGPDNHFTSALGLRAQGTAVASSIGLLPRPLEPGYFRIKLTGLHTGPDTVAPTLARLEDFTDASVDIPINDAREASVTISIHDHAGGSVEPYKTMLHIVYATPNDAYLVFWGIVTQPVWDTEQETLTIPAVDLALRLQNRQVRWGRRILNPSDDPDMPNPFNDTKPRRSTGFVPLDYVGLGWLRDGAELNDPQTAAGWPPLGIVDGHNTASGLPLDTDYKIEARRGDTIWDVIQEMATYQITPDFELEPVDTTYGVYARLNTHPRQGSSDHSRLIFDNGFGRDNCLITYQPGGKLINYAHVLSTGDEKRVTVSDEDSGAIYGPYTNWDSTDYPAKALAALADTAGQTINAYSLPPDYFQITPNLDLGMYYLDDFKVGDALTARVRRGQLKREFLGDITKVTLTQDDAAGNVKPELEVAINESRTITDQTEG